MVCDKSVCVCDKVVRERWFVTKLCVVCERWCVTKMVCDKVVRDKVVCERLCLKDGV